MKNQKHPIRESRERLMEVLNNHASHISHPEQFKELAAVLDYLKWSDRVRNSLIDQLRASESLLNYSFTEEEKRMLFDKLDLKTSVSRTCAKADSVIFEAMQVLNKPKQEIKRHQYLNKVTYGLIKGLDRIRKQD